MGRIDKWFNARCWPEDASRENGSYPHVCVKCRGVFLGNQRVICRECAHAGSALTPPHDARASHPATSTGLTLLERLDMMSWDLTRAAAAEIRSLRAALDAAVAIGRVLAAVPPKPE